jgi:hypothetical protein
MCFQCESEPRIRILEHVYLTSAIEENLTCVDRITSGDFPEWPFCHRALSQCRMSLFAGAATSRRLASNWSRHILYVDRGVVVLNKPSGLICQKDRTGDSLQVRKIVPSKRFSDTSVAGSIYYADQIQGMPKQSALVTASSISRFNHRLRYSDRLVA